MKKCGVILLMIMLTWCSACSKKDASVPAREMEGIASIEKGSIETLQSKSGSDDHYPVSIKVYTNDGKEVIQTIEVEPKKVVVVGSAIAELMIEFGQKEKVVGLGYPDQSFSKYASEIAELPLITKSWPSKESVLALQPDIIYSISSAFKEDLLGDISFWNDRGIPVVSAVNFTVGRSIEEYFTEIKNFGLTFNVEDKTNAYLKTQSDRINQVIKIAEAVEEVPKVLFIGGARDTNYYYPPSWCMIDEMIEGAGGEYMELSKDGYMELSLEAIIAANPEKIIITEFQEPDSEVTKNKLLTNEKLQNVSAIKTGNVMVAEYTSAINGGLQLADLYEDVAAFIHPELFGGK
ncbi:ABC transporter substrate-binding protein [Paenibacillus eucommiae]|uniref:Iron complex transport system substrate-binding protein n=1 Tax=Paenibacillus eucommiae TaxID=1355755 RepID=A0ABS4IQA3_9BACL|nr:ABC transporter substrate-binding protein [Paenibacillus eucommiae]MBP1989748.1 iron complex transport system substrate-binding protein [Paenibacillus eucommiae]